jgi:hypothetical protein
MIYPAPKLVQPANGATLKYDPDNKHGGVNTIVYEWLSVGTLESGKIRCSWKDQPQGSEAAIFDRYFVDFEPNDGWRRWPKDAGQVTKFGMDLLRSFQIGTTYTWRVVVSRYCVPTNIAQPNRGSPVESFLGVVSPYSESRTFSYSP